MIRPSTMKHRVDLDSVVQNRQVLSQQPAREAAELPVRRQRRRRSAQDAFVSLRDLLEGDK